jgi:hypothetical protein
MVGSIGGPRFIGRQPSIHDRSALDHSRMPHEHWIERPHAQCLRHRDAGRSVVAREKERKRELIIPIYVVAT